MELGQALPFTYLRHKTYSDTILNGKCRGFWSIFVLFWSTPSSLPQVLGVSMVQCTRIRQFSMYLTLINRKFTCANCADAIKPIKSKPLEGEHGAKTPSAVCFTRAVGTIQPAVLNTLYLSVCEEKTLTKCLVYWSCIWFNLIVERVCSNSMLEFCTINFYIWSECVKLSLTGEPGKCLICSYVI